MLDRHRIALQNLATTLDSVFVIRVSDATSTKLVKAKVYRTKGLDVHDKSSNWGPVAGFVPTDLFFNKQSGNLGLNSATMPSPEVDIHAHAKDILTFDTKLNTVQLYLSPELRDDFMKSNKEAKCPLHDNEVCPEGSTCVVSARPEKNQPNKNKCVIFCFKTVEAEGKIDVSYYLNGENTFPGEIEPSTCDGYLTDVTIANQEGSFHPLKVWAYDSEPITGDMDVWGILPRLQSVKPVIESMLQESSPESKIGSGLQLSFPGLGKDNIADPNDRDASYLSENKVTPLYIYARSYEKSVPGGLSTCSHFEYRMIDKFNQAILDSDNADVAGCTVKHLKTKADRQNMKEIPSCTTRPLKMHGDEIKNIDFAQPLDGKLVFVYPQSLGDALKLVEPFELVEGITSTFNVRF
jgi:hypothetical protein